MVLNNMTQLQIYSYSGDNNMYKGKIWAVQVMPSGTVVWEKEEERPPEIVDFVSGQPKIDPLVRKQLVQLIYNFNMGEGVGKAGNINGYIVQGTTPAVGNEEFSIAHKFNVIPKFFFTIMKNGKYSPYKGDTAWTKDTVYLKCESTNMNFYILLFGEE